MKLYSKYISNKLVKSFLSVLFLLVSLIWFSKTISFVKYVTENGIEISQFLSLFILILPWLLTYIIPIALFSAVIIIFNRMISDNEIAILRSSGLTNFKISNSAIKVALYASIFCYIISFFIMPYANKKLRLARINFESNYSNIAFNEGVFENLKSLTIYVKKKDSRNILHSILLNDESNKEYSLTITSKTGNLSFKNENLLLYMQNGTIQRYNRELNTVEILEFDDYVFNLTERDSGKIKSMRWKPKERYLSELLNPNDDSTRSDIKKYKSEIQQRLTYPLMSVILTLIAISSLLSGNFSRKGSNLKILTAISLSSIFMITTISLYKILEVRIHLAPLLYLNFAIFSIIPLKMMIGKKLK